MLGKDGKIKKKRGRKPTPGLSDEDRRKARLLKNRRTAEISRRRKLAQLNKLTEQRDSATNLVAQLSTSNLYLIEKVAALSGLSVEQVLQGDDALSHAYKQSHDYLHNNNNIMSDCSSRAPGSDEDALTNVERQPAEQDDASIAGTRVKS